MQVQPEPRPQASLGLGGTCPRTVRKQRACELCLRSAVPAGAHGPRLPLVPQLVSGGAWLRARPSSSRSLQHHGQRQGEAAPGVGVEKDQDQEPKTHLLLNVDIWFQDLRVRN